MQLPEIGNYGRYSSGNYGANTLTLDIGPIRIWFSYQTPVAFHVDGYDRVVHDNNWGVTTGKHLNWIDGGDKVKRVDSNKFQELWNQQVAPLLDSCEISQG